MLMKNPGRQIILLILVLISVTGFSQKKGKNGVPEEKKLEHTFCFFEGCKQKMLGNHMEAMAYFSKCIEIDPSRPAAFYELANLLFMAADYNAALAQAKQAAKLDPGNLYFQIQLASLYERTNQLKNAVSVYKDLVKRFPGEHDIHFNYATLLAATGKTSQALKELDELEKKVGISEMVSLEKEKILFMAQKPEEALVQIQNLVKAFPEEPRYLGMLAEAHINLQQYDKAMEAYDKLLEVDPENGRVHLSLADFYRIQGNPQESFKHLKLAYGNPSVEIELKVKMLLTIYNYNAVDDSSKNQAYELISELLLAHPDDIRAHTIHADFLVRDKRYREARDELRIVAAKDKGKYMLWEQLIILEADLQDYQAMYDESSEAIEYFPNQPSFYLYKGAAAIRLQKNKESIEALNVGKELVIDNDLMLSEFYSNLGEAYNRMKNHELSDSMFEKCLEINPENKLVMNNYSYYLTLRKEKKERAIELSSKCVEKEPENSTYLDTYAWALYVGEKYEEARKYIEKSIANGGNNNAVIVEHYGDILFRLGETKSALEQWMLAKEKGQGSDKLDEKIEKKTLIE